ncbi:hypothetical protein [Streptomyces xylophagus]|nr:hypothetical protein [Streptomyces xylophagus]
MGGVFGEGHVSHVSITLPFGDTATIPDPVGITLETVKLKDFVG